MTEWRCFSHGFVDYDAVAGGHDVNGETIYVGRIYIDGDHVPGKIVPSHGCIYVPYDGKEVPHTSYEYMIRPRYGNIEWVSSSNGHVPSGAVVAGETKNNEPLFVGRCYHNGSWIIGKVHPSHGCLYIPFGGDEISERNYEVLTVQY